MNHHTPTPWQAVKYPDESGYAIIGVAGDERIADIEGNQNNKVNAAYIVRAVNAHEELLGFIQSEFDECCGKFKTFCEPCKRRLDVIAKAEGR